MNPKSSFLWVLVSMAILWAGGVSAQGFSFGDHVEGHVIVKYRTGLESREAAEIRAEIDPDDRRRLRLIEAEVLRFSNTTVEEVILRFQNHPDIEYIEPDYLVHAIEVTPLLATTPNDPSFGDQWGLNNTGQTGGRSDADIDAPEAWDIETGDAVIIGVIDTGVDWGHEDLAANMWTNPGEDAWADPNDPNSGNGVDDDGNGYIDDWRGWDFVNDDNNPFDDNDHGTHVAGIAAAVGNNGVGVAGVSWSALIMPLKFLAASGSGSTSDAILAVEYATENGADLTNNSWGGGAFSQALRDAIQASADSGMVFVAAAGNSLSDNDSSPHYPSSYDVDNIIAVASTNDTDYLSSFSNYGVTSVDVAAPGSSILSTFPNDDYDTISGTSMATPMVSGLASLLWSQNPAWTRDQVRDRIFETVEPTPGVWGNIATGGRVNAHQALTGDTPEATVSSTSIDETLVSGDTVTVSFTITNDGSSDMKYAVAQVQDAGDIGPAGLYVGSASQQSVVGRPGPPEAVAAHADVDTPQPTLAKGKAGGPLELAAATNTILAPVTRMFSYDVSTEADEVLALGVEYDGTYFWVTGAGEETSSDPNRLFQLDEDGNLIATFNQPTTSIFGWRDLAFDGTFLYASDSPDIEQIDPNTGGVTGVTIPGPLNPNRALAYDPDTDHFWTANFSSDIYEIDRSGTVINQYSNDLSIYGMAWDDATPGGPFLWIWSQDGNGTLASQFDPETGALTGLAFDGDSPPGGIAGGAAFTSDFPGAEGLPMLIGMHQSGDDHITGYLLPPNWIDLSPSSGVLTSGNSATIEVTLDASDLAADTYTANLHIYTNDPDDDEGLITLSVTLTVQSLQVEVVINEVVTDPQRDWNDSEGGNGTAYDPVPGTGLIDADDEWIELYNNDEVALDLTENGGWTLIMTDGSAETLNFASPDAGTVFQFSNGGSLSNFQPGEYLVIGNPPGDIEDNVYIELQRPNTGSVVVSSAGR